MELGKPYNTFTTGWCDEPGTQSKKKRPTKHELDEQLVRSMVHRMENVTGINKSLQETILK